MPGKKRSETVNGEKRQAESPGRRQRLPVTSQSEYRQAFCPVCCTAHGYKRLGYAGKGKYTDGSLVNYWQWIADREAELGRGESQPFGVIQEAGKGRGHSFAVLGHFSPAQDQDGFYPLIKARLLLALERWLRAGWITQDDIKALL